VGDGCCEGSLYGVLRKLRCCDMAARKYDGLTPAEDLVMEYVLKGWQDKQIARELDKSPATVTLQVRSILHKLGASNRTQAVAMYLCPERFTSNPQNGGNDRS
jgi:DNA-binding NarL/FixJ family response regulator